VAAADLNVQPSQVQWRLSIRLLVAVPGLAAALALFTLGGYLLVAGVFDRALAADDEFASIAALALWLAVLDILTGLALVALTAAVTTQRPKVLRLSLAAVVAALGASCAAYMLALGSDVAWCTALLGVLLYLGAVAVVRLRGLHRGNA
jgi:hypothetical protein